MRMQARCVCLWRRLLASMQQITSSKRKTPSTAIHLDQHQPLWATTNALDSPVHIATHEGISRRMCLHALADCEVVCGVVCGVACVGAIQHLR
jgi:hypothetical protein